MDLDNGSFINSKYPAGDKSGVKTSYVKSVCYNKGCSPNRDPRPGCGMQILFYEGHD